MIRVSAVSYWNTHPFIYGIRQTGFDQQLDLSLDIPAICAEKLINNDVDLGLIPVAVIPRLAEAHVISDYCIGAEGAVRTVAIYAEQPIEQLDTILLDYQSRTSVALTRLLLRHFWQLTPNLVAAHEGYETSIANATGALIIGDRAMGLELQYPYVYDLGQAWTDFTGLPFVFAAWVSNKPLPPDFIKPFNAALAYGVNHIPELLETVDFYHPNFDLQQYLTTYIRYDLDDAKLQGLQRFLDYLQVA